MKSNKTIDYEEKYAKHFEAKKGSKSFVYKWENKCESNWREEWDKKNETQTFFHERKEKKK